MRRWTRWLIGGIAAALVVVVGGPFVYIHFIEGKPPPPLSLPSQTTNTTAADPSPTASPATTAASAQTGSTLAGTWNVGDGQAGYRVKETLFGQSNTAVGRTTAISGSIVLEGSSVKSGQLTVDLTKVSSDQSQRDEQFRGRIMNTSRYPTATFTLTSRIDVPTVPADGVETTAKATGDLTMHGVTKSVTFTVTAKRSGGTIGVSGSIPITFADWNISNPSGGPAQTENNGILEFVVNFTHG